MSSLDAVRARFAQEMGIALGLAAGPLLRAFATVPRERFCGPGPWLISTGSGYQQTPDADPVHLYADVRVALDAERELNNGKPYNHAGWMAAIAPAAGEHLIHIGAGTGYYTAILAELVGPQGRVTAIELDPGLAARLQRNVAELPQVRAVHGNGVELELDQADGIYVNAGLTGPPAAWLDRLKVGGRILLPLVEMGEHRQGAALWARRPEAGHHEARFLSAQTDLRIFPCAGGRQSAAELRLAEAFARGGHNEVRSLRRDRHPREPQCWLHAEDHCLSRRGSA